MESDVKDMKCDGWVDYFMYFYILKVDMRKVYLGFYFFIIESSE